MDMGISENIGITYSTESPSVKKAVRENTDSSAVSTTNTNAAEKDTAAVTYEKSTEKETESAKKLYKPDTDLIQKLKTDAENRSAQLRSRCIS